MLSILSSFFPPLNLFAGSYEFSSNRAFFPTASDQEQTSSHRDGILKKEPVTILDRQVAIKKAVDLAKKGDVVVVTGKGSEPYIHVKNGAKIVWSDTRAVLKALKKEAPMTL